MSKISNFFRFLDFVGYNPKIHFQEKNKFRTAIGGIFTSIIIILTILATISFGKDIYQRTEPIVLLNKNFIEPERNVTQELILGYRLFYTGGVKIADLDKLVDIFVVHTVFDPKLAQAFLTRYEVIKCGESEIYKKNYLNITTLMGNPDDYLCVPNNTTLYLKGKYGSPLNNHMHLRIGICKNSTENNNKCFPDDVIRKKMTSFFVSFFYRDAYIDAKDYENPVKYYITSNTLKSSAYTFRQDSYLFKDVTFSTDSGVILSDPHLQDYVQLDTISSGSTAEMTTDIFTNVIIGLNNLKDVYSRKYIKIQDVSAQVGGIIKFFLIFAEFFLSFFNYIPFLEALFGKLYDYGCLQNDQNPNNNKNKKIYNCNNNYNYNNYQNNRNILNQESQNNLKSFGNINIVYANFGKNINMTSKSKIRPDEIINDKGFFKSSDMVPRTHSWLEIIFRSCLKKKIKYSFMQKIMNDYKQKYDVERIFENDFKLNIIWKYSFNQVEQEIIKLFSIIKFYERYNDRVLEDKQISNPNISESKIFSKLNIPKNLIDDKLMIIDDKNYQLFLNNNNERNIVK